MAEGAPDGRTFCRSGLLSSLAFAMRDAAAPTRPWIPATARQQLEPSTKP